MEKVSPANGWRGNGKSVDRRDGKRLSLAFLFRFGAQWVIGSARHLAILLGSVFARAVSSLDDTERLKIQIIAQHGRGTLALERRMRRN